MEYDGQTFRLATAEMCTKFMRSPQTYFEADLPVRRQRRYRQPDSQTASQTEERRYVICIHTHMRTHTDRRETTHDTERQID